MMCGVGMGGGGVLKKGRVSLILQSNSFLCYLCVTGRTYFYSI